MPLTIQREGAKECWALWPVADSIPAGEVREAGSYTLHLSDFPGADQAVLSVDDVPLEALRSSAGTGKWRWSPGFYSGTVTVELAVPQRVPVRFEVIIDPDLRKLTRQDFDTMVREILEDTFALFALSSFRKGIARGNGPKPPAIARLEFLRSRIDELEQVIAQIAARPRRRLKPVEVEVPYYRAAGVTGPQVLRSLRSGKIRKATSAKVLSPNLKGYLPDRIKMSRKAASLDLPEHRQMAACLRHWTAWLSAATELLDKHEVVAGHEASSGWTSKCRQLTRRIGRLADDNIFADVGEAPATVTVSALFRNDPHYRKFYSLWRDMNAGIAAVFGDFLNLPIARTFDLYELWCFLRLLRASASEFGAHSIDMGGLFVEDAAGGLTIASGSVRVGVGANWILCFQKQYREFWLEPDHTGTFSRVMTPDIALERVETGTNHLIVLDAKYRIEEGLNDGLSSIHTYRDSIVRENSTGDVAGVVSGAYLLAPYIPDLSSSYRATSLPGRLFHPEYRAGFRFGAVTMKPGMPISAIGVVLRTVLDDAMAVA